MACALQAFAECMHDVSDTLRLSTPCPHLDASMTTQVEVKLSWVGDFRNDVQLVVWGFSFFLPLS